MAQLNDPRLRVAVITRRVWPLIGGAEVFMLRFAQALQRTGHHAQILSAQWRANLPAQQRYDTLDIVRLPQGRMRCWGTLRYMTHLALWLKKHRAEFDLVYVSMLKHDAYTAIQTLHRTSIPVVLRAEGGGGSGDCHWQSTARFGRRIRRACQRADAVIAPSPAIRQELFDAGYAPHRVHTIPNGVPIPELRSRVAARASLASASQQFAEIRDDSWFVFVGRLDHAKGVYDLLDAWTIVESRLPLARLLLIGEGPEARGLKHAIHARNLDSSVLLPGSFPDINEILAAADVFVLPSHQEGMSLALLEAMAAGRPVIASDIPGNRRVVDPEQNGVLCGCGDPEAWAAGMMALLADPSRARKLGQAAREHVTQHFSLQRSLEQHLKLFHRLRTPS